MWVIDSGASNHMSFNQELFTNYKRLGNSRKVVTASSASSLSVIGEGDVRLNVWTGDAYQTVVLENCLYVDGLSNNLFSVPAAVLKGVCMSMNMNKCTVSMNGKTIAVGSKIGNLYYLDAQVHTALVSEELQHRRMGHASNAPWPDCKVCKM